MNPTVSIPAERLGFIADNVPAFLVHCDTDARYTFVNLPYARRFGLTPADLLGKHMSEILGKPAFDLLAPRVATVLAGNAIEFEECVPYSFGQRWVLCTYTPERDARGNVTGFLAAIQDITERKLSEGRLSASQERFRNIFEHTPTGIAITDPDGHLLQTNAAFARMLGYTEAELHALSFSELVHPDDRETNRQHVRKLLDQQVPFFEIEQRFTRKSGQIIWGRKFASLIRDPQGQPLSIAALITDITEARESRELILQERSRFDFATNAAEIGYWFCNLPFDKLIWDDRVKEHFWLPPDADVTIDLFYEIIHPDDRERTRRAIERSIAEHNTYDTEYRTVSPDGRYKWIRATGRCAYAPDGSPIRFDGVTRDITESKHNQEALHQSEAQLRERIAEISTVLDTSPALIFIARDRQCREVVANHTAQAFLRLPPGAAPSLTAPSEVRPSNFRILKDARPLSDHELPLQRAALTGKPIQNEEVSVLFDDGSVAHLLGHAAPLFHPNGEVRGAIAVFVDITERARVAQEMRDKNHFMELAQSAAKAGFWQYLPVTDEAYLSQGAQRLLGLHFRPNLRLGDILERVDPQDRDHLRTAIEQAVHRDGYSAEFRVLRPDGSTCWLAGQGRVLTSPSGEKYVVGITLDITSQKLSEEALRKSEKLAVVGRMAATISHEINNPLEAVTNLLYLIKTSTNEDQVKGLALTAEEELARVTHIVTHTLRFNRQTSGSSHENLSALLDSAVAIYASRLKHSGIHLVRQYRSHTSVPAFASELRQVFSNFIGNAFDATRAGGHVTLRTSDVTNWATGKPAVRVSIADNGIGMDAATRTRLFEPFFSTKGLQGTGLGLWVSREILEKHQAPVRIHSRPGVGTVFSILFPVEVAASASA